MFKIRKKIIYLLMLFISVPNFLLAEESLVSDSRIKTYIFNENEIFKIIVHYGYQSTIELAKGEQVQVLSIGDNFSWIITPIGRRIFIKPLEDNINTNMTLITNRRTYQFDLFSKTPENKVDSEISYVVRFIFPKNLENNGG